MDGMWFVGLLAQAEPAAKAAEASAKSMSWQFFVIAAAVFILPFVLGQLLSQVLKMKEIAFPVGVVLCSLFLAIAPFAYQVLRGHSLMSAIPLGIDLAGGTNLIYAVDREQAEKDQKEVDNATMNKMIGAVARRINPSGAEEVTVRRVGEDRLEIIIPGADREVVEKKKRQIVDLGSLEFAILANDKDHSPQIDAARKLRDDQDNLMQGGRLVASWRNVAKGEDVTPYGGDRTAVREVERMVDGEPQKVLQFLVIHEPPDRAVTGRYLTRVSPAMDNNGQLAVSFNFNARGSQLFSVLTGRYQPDASDGFQRRLAVLLNGEVQTAPNLKDRITGSGQISGNFSKQEIDDLINVLNAGALEVPLIRQPVSEFTISPTLGIDVQTKGLTAIVASMIVVLIFMVVYYGVAGFVADLCLIMNLVLVVGAMAFIQATFTLPGLAGLVLTIGMAVDANVLIFERMREELARGSSLRMAIENGFDKAFSTIIDSNVTSLITAVILYMIGSDQIRGFAVSLFIGLVTSLFTVLYFSHLCFKVMERQRWVRTLKMRQFFGETKIDFLAKRSIAFAASGLVILAGLVALFARGSANYDIDFTGGTMVTFEFTDSQPTDAVRAKLAEVTLEKTDNKNPFLGNISLERLVLTGETAESNQGHRFRLRTTQKDQELVTAGINAAFGNEMPLKRLTMTAATPTTIAMPEKPEEANRFSGGQEAVLTFSNAVAPDTAAVLVADALHSLPGDDGAPKYTSAANLVDVQLPAGTEPTEDGIAKSTGMTVRVIPQVTPADFQQALTNASEQLANTPAFEEVNAFDTSVATETQIDALLAILASLVAIVIYIWFRFEKVYFGYAAVVALAHDVLVTLGAVALGAYLSGTPLQSILLLEDFKVNLALIASLLTIVGYSLNDTIVIFDRIREIKGKNPAITYEMINQSVNQTLSRTVLTFFTTFMVVLLLYVFGGSGIHGFAYSMIIGSVAGVYSTIYIANPVLLWLVQRGSRVAPVAKTTTPTVAAS
ncbi:protein translocase subunit SecD [bacterium]|nr:protein translocase subunit SecD [bacterium]